MPLNCVVKKLGGGGGGGGATSVCANGVFGGSKEEIRLMYFTRVQMYF